METLDKVFWIRIGLAIIAGLVTSALGFNSFNEHAVNGIGIGILFYILSYVIAVMLYKRIILSSEKSKLFTTGIGAYIFMFLFIWILYNTIIFANMGR